MSPTMQKILKKFDHVFDSEGHEDPLFLSLTQEYREFLQRSCVEYAEELIDQVVEIECKGAGINEQKIATHVLELLKEYYTETIKQDSLDLPTN